MVTSCPIVHLVTSIILLSLEKIIWKDFVICEMKEGQIYVEVFCWALLRQNILLFVPKSSKNFT